MDLEPDVVEFMATHRRAVLVTRRRDGSPTAHPMGAFSGEGRLFLNMYAKSAKHRNLLRNPDGVTCLVMTASDAPDPQAVVYRGTARLLDRVEVTAAVVPDALEAARTGATLNATGDDETTIRRRRRAVTDRTAAGVRVVWEIVPAAAGFLDDGRST